MENKNNDWIKKTHTTYELKDKLRWAVIFIEEDNFDRCEYKLANNIYDIDDWRFLYKVAKKIVELCGEEGDKKVKDPSNLNKILNHQSPPNQLEQKTTYKDIESFKEKIKLIPSLSNVLIEYEKLYSNKKAYEMFEILIDDIAKKFNELLKSIPEENIKIKKNEYEE